jgi:hypothetical protein
LWERRKLSSMTLLSLILNSLGGSEFSLAGVSSHMKTIDLEWLILHCGGTLTKYVTEATDFVIKGSRVGDTNARAFGRRGKPSVVQERQGEGGHDSEHFGVFPAGESYMKFHIICLVLLLYFSCFDYFYSLIKSIQTFLSPIWLMDGMRI